MSISLLPSLSVQLQSYSKFRTYPSDISGVSMIYVSNWRHNKLTKRNQENSTFFWCISCMFKCCTFFSRTSMQLCDKPFAWATACRYWRPLSLNPGSNDITLASESFATRSGKKTLSSTTKHNKRSFPCNCKHNQLW